MSEEQVKVTVTLTGADAKLWNRCVEALSGEANGVRIEPPVADVARVLFREGAARLLSPAKKEAK